jgi:hypothetical protein
VVERQRRQQSAGRLDLLLEDSDGEVRYEVELMLGQIDESHLVRAIEYWDIERRRYPAYDHRAVIIAEDITTRFLNVITLFSGSIPLIAIQVNAVSIEGKAAITFLRVVDSTDLRRDDQADVKSTDRADWISRAGGSIIELVDKCLSLVNETARRQYTISYNKTYIGLADGSRISDFVWFFPKKTFLRIALALDPTEIWAKRVHEAELDFKIKDGYLRVDVTPKEFGEKSDLLRQMLREALTEDEKE